MLLMDKAQINRIPQGQLIQQLCIIVQTILKLLQPGLQNVRNVEPPSSGLRSRVRDKILQAEQEPRKYEVE